MTTSELISKVRTLSQSEDISELKNSRDMAQIFAACAVTSERELGLIPYDEQLTAAERLTTGAIIEMKTGEGKTLCAAFAACYMAKNGRRTHILTFNDYLAKRDYMWMKPIYDALGITAGYIDSGCKAQKRKELYQSEVLYITAKEAGFDFLRDFVAPTEDACVQNGFDFAIADEADSIMIDEARVPLVIAGETSVKPDAELPRVFEAVSTFDRSLYEINEEAGTIYLTRAGEKRCEELIANGGGLYDEENNDLLTRITDCLKACFLLHRDVDYIVKDGSIRIIDEFTGRAVENRRYPGVLQSAVELKEGIEAKGRGAIMGIVPMQFFLRQYPLLSGMTGTAKSSEDEFYMLYDLKVCVIPTHTPCKRIDRPYEVYLTKQGKQKAIIDCIKQAHEKKRPILVGTQSIEQSEALYESLSELDIPAQMINAKNDELEADIIKDAGRLGAVTISANMSGRGVDIRLGGADEAQRDEVRAIGGLLILGTFMSESERGDMQLSGRSGRQGDEGESRFIISLEDDIMKKYDFASLVPSRRIPKSETGAPIEDKLILKEVKRLQRIAQGDNLDLRTRLLKFTMIGEKHRDIVFGKRKAVLTGKDKPEIWQTSCPENYAAAAEKFGREKVDLLQKQTLLQVLNECWSDYLDYTSYLRDGIHLTRIGGKNPAEEYNITCEEFFSGLEGCIIDEMESRLEQLISLDNAEDYKLNIPTELWTYTLNESGEELVKKSFIATVMSEDEYLDEDDEKEYEYDDEDYENDSEDESNGSDDSEDIKEDSEKPKKGFFSRLFGK